MPKVWLNGALVDREEARVSVYDHGLLYGDGCFEGIRSYGGRIMKLESHLDRLYTSAERIRLAPPYSREEIARAIRETLADNALSDAYIRLVFTRGVGTLGLNPFKCPKAGAFIITDSIELYPKELYDKGMGVMIATRRRVPIDCLDPSIKSLNYLNNILAKIEAMDAGVLEAIMLNQHGDVAEGTGDNIFLVQDGDLITPPPEAGILHGITRAFAIEELAPSIGRRVYERRVQVNEVFTADEVFLTGTAAEIIGVTRVDEREIGDGRPGPITRAMMEAFARRIREGVPED